MPKTEKKARIVVKEDDVPTEIIAKAVVDISEGMRRILDGKLNKRAIVLLIKDSCRSPLGKGQIEDVLDAIADLKKLYVRE